MLFLEHFFSKLKLANKHTARLLHSGKNTCNNVEQNTTISNNVFLCSYVVSELDWL